MKRLHALPSSRAFRWAALLLAACVLSSPATSLAAHPSRTAGLASPKQVVLGLPDVTRVFGGGFKRTSAAPLARQNAAAAAAILHSAAYTKLVQDWISGYAVEYMNPTTPPMGMTVSSSVNLYRSAGTAQRAAEDTFATRVGIVKHAGGGMFKSSLVRYSGVGEYAELTRNVMKPAQGGKSAHLPGADQVMLYFTRGHYDVSVKVVSSGAVRMSAVLAAARLIDSRLRGG